MERLIIILLHSATLLVGMLCLVFVGADYVGRYLFLGIIGINLILILTQVYDLNVGILLKSIGVILVGNLATKIYTKFNMKSFFERYILKLKAKFGEKQSTHEASSRSPNYDFGSTRLPSTNKREDLNLSNGNHSEYTHRYHIISHSNNNTSPTIRESASREGSVNSASSRRSYHPNFPQCSATTMKGSQCTLTAYNSSGLCSIHSRGSRDRER